MIHQINHKEYNYSYKDKDENKVELTDNNVIISRMEQGEPVIIEAKSSQTKAKTKK